MPSRYSQYPDFACGGGDVGDECSTVSSGCIPAGVVTGDYRTHRWDRGVHFALKIHVVTTSKQDQYMCHALKLHGMVGAKTT